jgi:hypothetical protein
VSRFGDALTPGFGRLDGTLRAVVGTEDRQCSLWNDDHVILQVDMNGATYRLVVNVQSNRPGQDPRVFLRTAEAPLLGPPWQEGWHTGFTLDYRSDLGQTPETFEPHDMPSLVDILQRLPLGAPISVYATNGRNVPHSAHRIHRNGYKDDGAIALPLPQGGAVYSLFRFSTQTF